MIKIVGCLLNFIKYIMNRATDCDASNEMYTMFQDFHTET